MPRLARHLYLVAVDGKVIDANQRRKESYRDVNELITTVREYNGGQTIQTSYVYDPLKQITQVIDDRGNRENQWGRTRLILEKHARSMREAWGPRSMGSESTGSGLAI